MRNYKLGAILGCLWLSCDVEAAISNPSGIWNLSGKPRLTLTFAGRAYKVPIKNKISSTVQFQDGNSYALVAAPPNAWPTVHGQWRFNAKPKTYAISYPLTEFNLQTVAGLQALTPFLAAYLNNVLATVEQALKQNITVSSLQLKSYKDRGKLNRKGQLSGTQRLQVLVTYLNPQTNKNETTKIKATMAYKATQISPATQPGASSSCCTSNDPAQNLQDSQAFLEANKNLPGIQTTASGLQYLVIAPGSGGKPIASDKVTVAYRGTFPNGTVFDKSNPTATFDVSGVIPGFTEALELMSVGAYYRVYVPPDLGYSVLESSIRGLPPNAVMVFDVGLNKIN